MLELAQQLSYYLSVVDGGATSKLVGFGQQLASVGMIAQTVQSTFQNMTAPMNAVAAAWSQREQQINNVSRSLRQYEYVGESVIGINKAINASMPGASENARGEEFTRRYQNQFNEARQYSRSLLSEMNQLAARLPGEMNDYMQSFSQNLPHLSSVQGMTVGRAMNLTSYLTAGGVSAGIDAGQSARDLMQALTTGAHIVDRSWTEVWSQYARIKGPNGQMRKLDTAGFNRLTREDKVKVLEDIAQQLRPMMDATGDSYEALMGTFKSFRHELYLAATEPVFDAWKRLLAETNTQLAKFVPVLGVIGKFFGEKIASVLDKVTSKFAGLDTAVTSATGLFTRYLPVANSIFQGGKNFLVGAARNVGNVAGGAARYVRGEMGDHEIGGMNVLRNAAPLILMRVLGVSLGPVGWILASILTRMFLGGMMGSSLAAAAGAIQMILIPLFQFGMAIYRAYDAVMTVVTTMVAVLLPPILMLAGIILGPLLSVISFLTNLFLNLLAVPLIAIIAILIPAFAGLAAIIQVSMMGWRMLASLFGLISTQSFDVIDALRQTADFFQEFVREMQESLNYLLHEFGIMDDAEYALAQTALRAPPPDMPQWMNDLRDAIAQMGNTAGDLNRQGHGRGQPRPHTNQDFRYSRFDITQKFAEGFDPDRVASAMASELTSMSENQLVSGFQAAYSTT